MNTIEKHRIVVVEDDPDDFFLLERAIRKTGYDWDIRWIADGEEALDYFKSLVEDAPLPEVVVLDSQLPKQDGLTILKFIRTQNELRDLPVLKLMSQPNANAVRDASDFGATWCLPKSALFEEVGRFFSYLAKRADEPNTG